LVFRAAWVHPRDVQAKGAIRGGQRELKLADQAVADGANAGRRVRPAGDGVDPMGPARSLPK